MIESVEIENFKCFKTASLRDCRRINIIIGANGAGKTALLESMFIASGGTPELALRTRQLRGVEQNLFSGPLSIDYLFNDLFHDFDRKKEISLRLVGSPPVTRSVRVRYTGDVTVLIPNFSINAPPIPAPLEFRWEVGDAITECVPTMNSNGLVGFNPVAKVNIESFFFSIGYAASGAENATRFSALSQNFKEKSVVDLFIREFPEITGLSVEIFNGVPTVAASKRGMPSKLPVSLISSGMHKLLSILICLAHQNGTTLFIDEIENGLYYRRLKPTWEMIRAVAEERNGQVFASTHSLECLEAAYEVAREHPEDFAFIHTGEDGVRQFDSESFSFAIKEGTEIR